MTARAKERRKQGAEGGLVADQRGAVLAEFVVVFVPLMTTFFVFVQLSAIAAASIMVKHAAVVGARAAAVFSNANDNVPELKGDDGKAQIEGGVKAALGTWQKSISTSVEVNDRSSRNDNDGQYDLVTVTVTGTYRCEVPLGKMICPGGVKTFVDTKSMPHQGARYKL